MDRLQKAHRDLRFLLERGYPKASSLRFIGDHFQLRQEERDLLYRATFTRAQCHARRQKRIRLREFSSRRLVIDGHNVLITLESAIRKRPLVLADDGFIRDVSRIFRGFRPTDRTRQAWSLVQDLLKDYPPLFTTVILDAPMSRSKELAGRIRRWMQDGGLAGETLVENKPEGALLCQDGVKATADSVILDKAGEVFDLAGHIITKRMRLKPIVLLNHRAARRSFNPGHTK